MKIVRSPLTVIALSLLLAPASSTVHAQGSLTPPDGPPAPVFKTLDQVEARTPVTVETCPSNATAVHVINMPGSYYLTGNIAGQSGKAAIFINASGVTLDLNGFNLTASVGATKGIIVGAIGGPVVIRNGSLRVWPQQAIQFTQASDFTIQDVAIYGAGGRGIDALGRGTIERVTVKGAVGYGIYCESEGQLAVRDCRVEGVTGIGASNNAGIHATKALITGCSVANVTSSVGGSMAGIYASGSSVTSCTVRNITLNGTNRVSGIEAALLVSDSSVSGVTGNGASEAPLEANGIFLCTAVSNCSVDNISGSSTHPAYGIGNCTGVDHCTVISVRSSKTHAGILAERVSECSVSGVTAGIGIKGRSVSRSAVINCATGITLRMLTSGGNGLGTSGMAKDNSIEDCTGTGIVVQTESATITGNNVNGDSLMAVGSTGILAPPGIGTIRIEGNTVSRWATGIEAPAATTLVIRNSAGMNTTDFAINANMPIVPSTALGSNPNANISQ